MAQKKKKPNFHKLRQHVNPLSPRFQKFAEMPWATAFDDVNRPVHVDIGCGRGSFVISLAQANPDLNVLGVDIRDPFLSVAKLRLNEALAAADAEAGVEVPEEAGAEDGAGVDAAETGSESDEEFVVPEPRPSNAYFLEANMSLSLKTVLGTIPDSTKVVSLSILHPDPWWKKKHHRRRLVNATFVEKLAGLVEPGVKVYLQSDVGDLQADMRACFDANDSWRAVHVEDESVPPLGAQSDRELYVLSTGQRVFRDEYERV